MADAKEKFDALWHAWNDELDGSKKQRLLNRIVRDNMPLVQKFVNRLMRRTTVFCDIEDAMQAGMIGLVAAIRKYDPKRPTRFSTMAYPWVRHEVSNMLQHQTQMYRPKGAGMPYQEHRKNEAIQARLGRDATAAELGTTEERLKKWQDAVFHFVPMNEITTVRTEEDIATHKQNFFQDDSPIADEQFEEAEKEFLFREAFEQLTEIERQELLTPRLPSVVSKTIQERAVIRLRQFIDEGSWRDRD